MVTRSPWFAGPTAACTRPGTLLGLLDRPELHDSRLLLRAGDSLVLFTDGVTEARSRVGRDLYGDDRLRDFIVTLRDMSADGIAEAIQQALLTFSGGKVSDDTGVLVLTVPPGRAGSRGAAAPGVPPGRRSG